MTRPLFTTLVFFTWCVATCAVADARVHVVSNGETLQSIAQQEHVSVGDIARLNQLEGGSTAPLVAGHILALDEASLAQLPAPAAPSADLAEQLRSIEDAPTTANPAKGADLAMWGGGAPPPAGIRDASPVHRLAYRIVRRASTIAVKLARTAVRFIGVPYVFGGTTPYGFDCSGYVQHVFAMLGLHLPRTADLQYYAGRTIGGRMLAGDLVFFQTYTAGPSHVGIYLGNGRFVHASSSHGVEVSRLHDGYWASRYLGARRYLAASRARAVTRLVTE